MKSWTNHPLRVTGRLLWLGGELLLAALNYSIHRAFCPRHLLPSARAAWLQKSARRFLRVFGVETKCAGKIPSSGLLVCNHLSYLDILVLAALAPSVFVAKGEVKHWPVLGWFTKLAGTIFVQREKRLQTAQSTDEINAALRTGLLVVLFPEGTSSGGETVLPFKSSLLEPAAQQKHLLTAGFLRYELNDGDVAEEVCYWRDMTLVPHSLNLLSKRGVRTFVRFNQLRDGSADRKELTRQLHAEVVRLKESVGLELDYESHRYLRPQLRTD